MCTCVDYHIKTRDCFRIKFDKTFSDSNLLFVYCLSFLEVEFVVNGDFNVKAVILLKKLVAICYIDCRTVTCMYMLHCL